MGTSWADRLLEAFRNWPWHEARSTFELALYFLAVLAILGCLIRLGTIRTIIHDFRRMRGPLWDLRTTVDDLRDLAPVLRAMTDQVALLDEKVEAARKQVAELQVESVSERTEASDDQPVAPQTGLVEVRPTVQAVCCELVSQLQIPCSRGRNREFQQNRRFWAIDVAKTRSGSVRYWRNSLCAGTGNFSIPAGNIREIAGI
jgi:hypothetical protein